LSLLENFERRNPNDARLMVLSVALKKIKVLWDIIWSRLVYIYRRFIGA